MKPDPVQVELGHEVRCIHCGYNLRGLSRRGHCPECSTSIERSCAGHVLANADRGWLEGLYYGTILVSVGIMLIVVVLISFLVIAATQWVPLLTSRAELGAQILVLGSLLLILAGLMRLTRQEPRLQVSEPQWSHRQRARAAMVLLLAAYCVQAMVAPPYTYLTRILAAMFMTGLFGSTLRVLAQLAERLPDERVAAHLGARAKEIWIAGGAFVVLSMGSWVATVQGLGLGRVQRQLSTLANLAFLLFGLAIILCVNSVNKSRRVFERALQRGPGDGPWIPPADTSRDS